MPVTPATRVCQGTGKVARVPWPTARLAQTTKPFRNPHTSESQRIPSSAITITGLHSRCLTNAGAHGFPPLPAVSRTPVGDAYSAQTRLRDRACRAPHRRARHRARASRVAGVEASERLVVSDADSNSRSLARISSLDHRFLLYDGSPVRVHRRIRELVAAGVPLARHPRVGHAVNLTVSGMIISFIHGWPQEPDLNR